MDKRVFFWPDTHIPFSDKRKVKLVKSFITDWQPWKLVFLGDLMDMESVSRFSEGTPKEWSNRVIFEVTQTKDFLKEIRELVPDSQILYLNGNHEDRLQKYIDKNAHALDGLISVKGLLELDELEIEHHEYGEPPTHIAAGYYAHHGNYVSKNAGTSAKSELEAWGVSGFSGHTHRLASYRHDTLGQSLRWFECGHLTDVKSSGMEYASVKNWCHGAGWGYTDGKKFWPFLSEFVGNTIYFDGQKYS